MVSEDEIRRVMAYIGSQARGKPKNFSEDELEKRRQRIEAVNAARAKSKAAKEKAEFENKKAVKILSERGEFVPK